MIDMDVRGIDETIKSLTAKRRAITRVSLNAARRVLRRRITGVKRRISTESGLGAAVFGGKTAGLGPLVSLIRAKVNEDAVETGIKFKGLARVIEKGGRLKPHSIEARRADLLVFAAYGRTVFAKRVNHPGAPVRPHGFGAQAVKDAGPEAVQEIGTAVRQLLQGDGGDGESA